MEKCGRNLNIPLIGHMYLHSVKKCKSLLVSLKLKRATNNKLSITNNVTQWTTVKLQQEPKKKCTALLSVYQHHWFPYNNSYVTNQVYLTR